MDIVVQHSQLKEMQGGIQTFAEKYGLSARRTNRIQLCCEELIYEMLEHACSGENVVEISLDVTYAEVDNSVAITFSCAGKPYNPLDKDFDEEVGEENLGAMILHNLSKNYSHEYSAGVNKINFSLT